MGTNILRILDILDISPSFLEYVLCSKREDLLLDLMQVSYNTGVRDGAAQFLKNAASISADSPSSDLA